MACAAPNGWMESKNPSKALNTKHNAEANMNGSCFSDATHYKSTVVPAWMTHG